MFPLQEIHREMVCKGIIVEVLIHYFSKSICHVFIPWTTYRRMMKRVMYNIGVLIFIILVLVSAGCITPPKGSTSSTPAGSSHTPEQTPTITVPTPNYVTSATPYPVKSQTDTSSTGYTVFPQPTPVSEDISCLIDFSTGTYAYNKTAFSFNLKNPPMYINYSVVPTNVTVNKYVESTAGGASDGNPYFFRLQSQFVV